MKGKKVDRTNYALIIFRVHARIVGVLVRRIEKGYRKRNHRLSLPTFRV